MIRSTVHNEITECEREIVLTVKYLLLEHSIFRIYHPNSDCNLYHSFYAICISWLHFRTIHGIHFDRATFNRWMTSIKLVCTARQNALCPIGIRCNFIKFHQQQIKDVQQPQSNWYKTLFMVFHNMYWKCSAQPSRLALAYIFVWHC